MRQPTVAALPGKELQAPASQDTGPPHRLQAKYGA